MIMNHFLDPADVHVPDFPAETIRVLNEKEIGKFGECRNRLFVPDIWGKLPPLEP